MAKYYELDWLLTKLCELDSQGKIESVVPTSVKSVSFNDMEGHTYVGVFKVTYSSNKRYRLFKVIFKSTYLEGGQDPLDYMRDCLEDAGFE